MLLWQPVIICHVLNPSNSRGLESTRVQFVLRSNCPVFPDSSTTRISRIVHNYPGSINIKFVSYPLLTDITSCFCPLQKELSTKGHKKRPPRKTMPTLNCLERRYSHLTICLLCYSYSTWNRVFDPIQDRLLQLSLHGQRG